ncbi:MAG: hypothetical protein GF346_03025, partial [Candidatus Eisenbacteria bacterium]|nr:hypothetical protein [Candidatus Latescibacterota bacterium]MBD3301394.1 hypothetical protein [Candidatus Eisenbacteria bacterium]
MQNDERFQRILWKGYRIFRTRRILEAAVLGGAVLLPFLLGALVLGLLIGEGRVGAWIVPAVVAAGVVTAVVRAVRYGLRHHLSFGEFLVQVERRGGCDRNELFNALHLGRAARGFEDPLAREIAEEVLRRGSDTAEKIPYRLLAPIRSLRAPVGQAAGAAVLVLLLGLLAPGATLRTAGQVLQPGSVPEREGVRIVVEPGSTTAPRGGSVPVRARLIGIDGEPTLFHRAGGGAWQRSPMQADSAGFSGILRDLQAETDYAVGLQGRQSETYRVTLVEPLRATGYEKRIDPPAYSKLAPEKELSPHGSIAVLTGSEVELRVSLSRTDAEGVLRFESGETRSLAPATEGVAAASWTVLDPDRYTVELTSPALPGTKWVSEPFDVDPIPDADPSLYLLAPGEQIDLPPEMRVVLEVDCADDFGITRLDLVWRRNEEDRSRTTIARWNGEREDRVLYPWNLEGIAMAPGDRIAYRLELTDNDAVSGPKTTISPEYLIRFPTVEEMYAQQEQERRGGIEDLRESLDRQVDLREQLDRMSREMRTNRGVDWERKQEVQEFLEKQEQVLEKMDDLAQAMDQQLNRMQQGELFSPEIVQKISQIQDLVREIQSPEFRQRLERLREAMQSLDPQEVQKALEEMKWTQQELERGLDRTLEMLQKLLAEEKLDEMIQRAERLMEEQNTINSEMDDAMEDPQGQQEEQGRQDQAAADSLQARQEAASEELEALRKQMEELRDLAGESHRELSEKMEGAEGEQSQEALDSAGEQMQQSAQQMQNRNPEGARSSGQEAAKQLQSFSMQMRQMQSQLQSNRTQELSRRMLALAGNLVELSKEQEALVERASARSTRDLAVEQDRLGRAASHVVDAIYQLARETPFISPAQARALGEVLNSLSTATNAFETGRRSAGAALGRQAETRMDEVVASLLESNEQMCNSSASSACNKPNPSSMMQGLSSQQRSVNQGMQQLLGESQGGQRLQQSQGQRLEQLAAQQEQIRAGLQEVAGSLGGRRDVLGRLDELTEEMEEVVEE